nr:hypothetical protein BJQ95_02924 [Cryobacterium sp. SO1]
MNADRPGLIDPALVLPSTKTVEITTGSIDAKR